MKINLNFFNKNKQGSKYVHELHVLTDWTSVIIVFIVGFIGIAVANLILFNYIGSDFSIDNQYEKKNNIQINRNSLNKTVENINLKADKFNKIKTNFNFTVDPSL